MCAVHTAGYTTDERIWQTQSKQVIKNISTLREDVDGKWRDKTTLKTWLTSAITLTSVMTDLTTTHDTQARSLQQWITVVKHISQHVFQHNSPVHLHCIYITSEWFRMAMPKRYTWCTKLLQLDTGRKWSATKVKFEYQQPSLRQGRT